MTGPHDATGFRLWLHDDKTTTFQTEQSQTVAPGAGSFITVIPNQVIQF